MNEAGLQIHQYSSSDIEGFRDLLALFGDVFDESETYQGAQPSDDYLARLLVSDTFIALGAVDDGKVVGGLAAYVFEKFEQARREIYLYDLAVQEAHRGQGIATGLIKALKEVARQKGAYVIFVQADGGEVAPVNLYAKFGQREDIHHFEIDP